MLQGLRKASQGPVMKAVLILLIISFVAWGITGYLSGNRASSALTINGYKVSAQELYSDYQGQLRAIQQQLGIQLTPELAAQLLMHRQVLAGTVQEKILEHYAKNLGLGVSDRHVMAQIYTQEAFAGPDGAFSPEVYQSTLRVAGRTTEGYENEIRETLLRSLLSQMYQAPAVNNYDVETLLKFELAEADFEAIKVSLTDVPMPAKPSEEEIKTRYEELKLELNTPELRSATVLEIDADALARDVEMSEEALKAAFENEPAQFKSDERRRARHILVSDQSAADDLYQQLMDGADFATLAKEHSKDSLSGSNGGDLGFFEAKEMTQAFAEAAFNLPQDEISKPVQSPFGYHIIQVTAIEPAEQLSYAEAKGSLKARLKQEQAEQRFYDVQTDVEDRLAGGEALETIAKDLDLTLKTYTRFNQQGQPANIKQGAVDEKIVGAAFTMFEGSVSDAPIELGLGRSAYVQVTAVEASRPLTLEEATPRITTELQVKARQQAAREKAEAIRQAWAKNNNTQNVMASNGLNGAVSTFKEVTRGGQNKPDWMTLEKLGEAFKADVGAVAAGVFASGQDYYAVRVTAKRDADLRAEEIASAKQAYALQVNNDLRRALIGQLLREARVSYDLPILKQAFGVDVKATDIPGAGNALGIRGLWEQLF